ncbi:MAG: hypothetical protein J5678_05035 [Bacteroidaceae bacterium]|nr:hypothetical protein [Bacteroidaceae bacterium]
MKNKLTLMIMALALCLTTNAKSPFAKLAKIAGVECMQYSKMPKEGLKLEGVSLGNGNDYEKLKEYDFRDIVCAIADEEQAATQLVNTANKLCKGYETVFSMNMGEGFLNILAKFGKERSNLAIVMRDDEEAVVLSANVKANKDTLLKLLGQLQE